MTPIYYVSYIECNKKQEGHSYYKQIRRKRESYEKIQPLNYTYMYYSTQFFVANYFQASLSQYENIGPGQYYSAIDLSISTVKYKENIWGDSFPEICQ